MAFAKINSGSSPLMLSKGSSIGAKVKSPWRQSFKSGASSLATVDAAAHHFGGARSTDFNVVPERTLIGHEDRRLCEGRGRHAVLYTCLCQHRLSYFERPQTLGGANSFEE